MSDTAGTLTPGPEPTPEPQAPPETPAAPAPPVDQEAAELAALETGAIEVPEGDGIVKLVPLSAVTTARDKAKEAREQAKAAQEQLDRLRGEYDAAKPYIEAAKAVLQQPQQQAPQPPAGPSPEQTAELEEVARDLEFYKTDGSLDLDRAGRHQQRILKAAAAMAQQQVAPLQQREALSRAQSVLNEAKNLKDPSTGEQADPNILIGLWNKVAAQPGGLETLTNPEAAMFIWGQAMNLTRWGKAQGPKVIATQGVSTAPLAPPVFVEASGGGSQQPTLSAMERRAAKDLGMTEAEYLKAAEKAPRGA